MGICCRRRTNAFHGEHFFVCTGTVRDTLTRGCLHVFKQNHPLFKRLSFQIWDTTPKNILMELSIGFQNTNFRSPSGILGGFDLWPCRHPATPTKHCWRSLGLFASHRYGEYLGRFLSRMLQHKFVGIGGNQKIILTGGFLWVLGLTQVNPVQVFTNNYEAELLKGENPAMLVKGVCPCTSSHSLRVFKSLQL